MQRRHVHIEDTVVPFPGSHGRLCKGEYVESGAIDEDIETPELSFDRGDVGNGGIVVGNIDLNRLNTGLGAGGRGGGFDSSLEGACCSPDLVACSLRGYLLDKFRSLSQYDRL